MTLGISVAEIVEKSNNSLLGIHPSWQRVRLDAVAEILNGFAFESFRFTKSEGYPLLRIRDIGKNTTEAFYSGPYDEAYIVKPGDLVIGMDGDFNCANWKGPQALLNQRVCKVTVTSPEYNSKFLEFAIPGYLKAINDNTSSVTVKHLSSKTVGEIPLPCPPLPEQERIVTRLEELLSDLEAGVAALERVRAGVKRYKASVLKAACEGKLFGNKWEVSGELPEGWRCVTVGEIAEIIGGVTKGRHFRGNKTVTLPYLRVANVQRGYLDLSEMKDIELLENEIEKYRLREGDVVLTEGGDWDKLGRSAIWKGQIDLCVHQNHIFRARVYADQLLSEWLLYYTNSEQGQKYFSDSSKQTTNLASINLTQLRSCPIPIPPLEEQRRIVAEVERRLESAQAVEAAVEAGLKRSRRLRQAVLRSAFEGRL
jgi:type I restriction enzyme S subunit